MAVINGTSKADIIKGTGAADLTSGQTLQDQINGLGGNDKISGSTGDDTIYGSSGDDTIDGSDGNDEIWGGTGDDTIIDGAGDDLVMAGEGDDTMMSGAGNDTYEGGKGFDTLDFSGIKGAVTIDMNRGDASSFTTGTDKFKDVEKVIGTSYSDVIKGSQFDDVIEAGNGDNVIRGGAGSDIMTGGDDHDTFAWKSWDVVDATGASRGVDTIHGFNSGNDTLDIRSLLSGLKTAGFDLKGENLDSYVHLTDTDAGTLLQVDMTGTGKFVDVALLADLHTGGATASAWASDISMLA